MLPVLVLLVCNIVCVTVLPVMVESTTHGKPNFVVFMPDDIPFYWEEVTNPGKKT